MNQLTEDRLRTENTELRAQVDELRARVKDLNRALRGTDNDLRSGLRLGLTLKESQVFAAILSAAPHECNRQRLYEALYDDSRDINPKILDVLISKLRRKLNRFRLYIITVRAEGWVMTRETAERVRILTMGEKYYVQDTVDGGSDSAAGDLAEHGGAPCA
jgi:DNA-binding response OmpR family regulator